MEEELSLDNILGTEEIDTLFDVDSSEEEPVNDQEISSEEEETEKETKEENQTTEVNVDTLFANKPESVGSEEDIKGKEDTNSQGNGTSPEKNFYSSIAKALKEEGIFPDLDDESYSNVKDPEDFRDLIEQQIRAGLDERQKRIDEALNAGVEPSEIKKYESTLNFLDSLDDDILSDEGEKGEKLRKDLIYQDFLNRGYSKERATKEVQKSLNAGTDIEDARESLKSNKEFFQDQYNTLLEEAREEAKRVETEKKKQEEALKNSILNDKNVFGDLSLDKSTRQKVLDTISRPVYKDPDSGVYYTALQKYSKENSIDFIKNVGLIFTLTDGFKNLDGLVKGKVKKEVKKGLRELENTLNNTARTSDGSLRYASGVNDDPESFIGKGWKLDV